MIYSLNLFTILIKILLEYSLGIQFCFLDEDISIELSTFFNHWCNIQEYVDTVGDHVYTVIIKLLP